MRGETKQSAALCGVLILLAGCAAGGGSPGGTFERSFTSTGVAFLDKSDQTVPPHVEWNRVLEATGEGLPAEGTLTAEERRISAMEAARYRAMARIAENLRGVGVMQTSRVRDMVFAGEEVDAETFARLQGVHVAFTSFDSESQVARVQVRVALDENGRPIKHLAAPAAPTERSARRIRAEAAARIDALAKLLEQISAVRIAQEVHVSDLMFEKQEAWTAVEGMLENVEFSTPYWVSAERCEVRANVRMPETTVDELRSKAREEQQSGR